MPRNQDLEYLLASLDPEYKQDPLPPMGMGEFQPQEVEAPIMPAATPPQMKMAPPNLDAAPKSMDPIVSDYIMKKNPDIMPQKFDYGDYSDENRKKLEDELGGYDWRGNTAAALASLGAAFQGGNSIQAANSVLDRNAAMDKDKLAQFDKKRAGMVQDYDLNRKATKDSREDADLEQLMDANSSASKMFQSLASKIDPSKDYSGMSGYELQKTYPQMQKLYEIDQKRLDRIDQRNFQKSLFDSKTQEKRDLADEKKKSAMFEVEDRRNNINDAITSLDKMIEDDGTWEATGSHNQTMDRLVDQIATDMAKLQDPNSVARPGEVELVKQQLIQSGFRNSNSTARDLLQKFKGEVDRRAETAYKVRGLEAPQKTQSQAPQTSSWNDDEEQELRDLERKMGMGSGMK